jgi:hypothetical protein
MLERDASHARPQRGRRSSPPAASTSATSSPSKGRRPPATAFWVPHQPGRRYPLATAPQNSPPRLRGGTTLIGTLCGQGSRGGAPPGPTHGTRERHGETPSAVLRHTGMPGLDPQCESVCRAQGLPGVLRLHPGAARGSRTHPALAVQVPRTRRLRHRPDPSGCGLGPRTAPPLKGRARAPPRSTSRRHGRRGGWGGAAPVGGRRDITLAPTEAAGQGRTRPGGTKCLQSDFDGSGREGGSGEPPTPAATADDDG